MLQKIYTGVHLGRPFEQTLTTMHIYGFKMSGLFSCILGQEPLKPRTAVKTQTCIGLSWTWAC
jgi:hypothetical protein